MPYKVAVEYSTKLPLPLGVNLIDVTVALLTHKDAVKCH
jgi:hypothetical protein